MNSIIIFVLSIFLARTLTKTDYGTYQQLQLISSTIIIFGLFGLPHSLYYFIPKASDSRKVIQRTLLICFASCTFLGLIVGILKNHLGAWFNNCDIPKYWYISFLILGSFSIRVLESVFISLGSANRYYLINIAFSWAMFVGILGPLLLGYDIYKILISLVLVNVITSMFYLFQYRKIAYNVITNENRFSVSLRDQIVYAIPIGMAFIMGIVRKQIDRFMISGFFRPADFAVYSRGAIDIPLIPILVYSFGNILMPKYIEFYDSGRKEKMVELWQKSIIYVVLVSFPVFVFLFYVANDLVVILYSVEYAECASVFRGYLSLLLIQITSFGSIVRAIGRPKIITYALLITIPINLVFAVILIPLIGYMGAVAGTVCSALGGAIFLLIAISRALKISVLSIWPWGRIGKVLIVALLSGSIFLVTDGRVTESGLVRTILCFGMYSIVYSVLIVMLRVVPAEDVASMRAVMGKFFI